MTNKQPCTCLGTCRGASGLGENWYCVLEENICDCPECSRRELDGIEGPCAACRRRIHESWHAKGLWWIRPEECHPGCPGRKPESVTA